MGQDVDRFIGARLYWLRRHLGRSVTDLAAATGANAWDISAFEAGAHMRTGLLARIADALAVDPAYFFSRTPGGAFADRGSAIGVERCARHSARILARGVPQSFDGDAQP